MTRTLKIVLLAGVAAAVALASLAAVRGKRAKQKPAAVAAVAEFLQDDLYVVEPRSLERVLPITWSPRVSPSVMRC